MAELRREINMLTPEMSAATKAERGRLTALMVNQRLGRRADEEAPRWVRLASRGDRIAHRLGHGCADGTGAELVRRLGALSGWSSPLRSESGILPR